MRILTDTERRADKRENRLRAALAKRGAKDKQVVYLAKRLGICDKTARGLIKDPGKMTVDNMRQLQLNADEIHDIVWA